MNDISVSVKFNIEDGNIIGQLSEVTSAFDDLKASASGVSDVISGLKGDSKSTSDIYADLTKNTADAFLSLSKGKGALEFLGKQGVNVAKSLSGVGGILGRVAGLAAGPWGAAFLSLSGVFVELAGSIFGTGKQIEALPDNVKGALDRVGRFTNQASKAAVEQAKKDRAELQSQLADINGELISAESEKREVEARFKRNSERAKNPLADKNGTAAIAAGKDAARLEELEASIAELSNAEEQIKASLRALNSKAIEENVQGELDAFTKARQDYEKALHEERLAFELGKTNAEEFAEKLRELNAQKQAGFDAALGAGGGAEFNFKPDANGFNPDDFCVKVEPSEADGALADAAEDVMAASESQVDAAAQNQNAAQANEMAAANALMAAESFSGAIEALANGILPGETAGVPDGVSLGGIELPFGELVQQFKDIFQKIPEDIKGAIENITGRFSSIFDQVKEGITSVPEKFREVFDSIKEAVTSVPEKFKTAFEDLKGIFTSIPDVFRNAFNGLKDTFGGLFGSGEGSLIGQVKAAFGSIFSGGEGSILGGIKNAFKDLFNGGQGLFSGLVDGIRGVFGDVQNSFSGFLDGFKGLFKGVGDNFAGIFDGLVDNFKGFFKRDSALGKIFGDLTKNFKGLFSEDGALGNLFGNLSQGFSNFFGQFGGFSNFLGNLGQSFQNLFGQTGGGALGGILGEGGFLGKIFGKSGALGSLFGSDGLLGGLFAEGGLLGGIGSKISGFVGNIGSKISGALGNIGGSLAGPLSGALSGAGFGKLLGVFGSKGQTGAQIGGAVGSAIGTVVPVIGNIVGGVIGSTLGKIFGGLFGKKKRGSVTINTTSSGDLRFSNENGKGKGRIEQARELGNAVFGELEKIAETLGGSIKGGLNLGSIGTRKSSFVFDPSGQGRTKGSGVQTFDSAEKAVFAALRRALGKGAVAGISQHVQRALTSTSDLNAALKKALDVQEFERYLEGLKPVMRNVFLEFENQAKERLDMARKFGFGLAQIEEYNAKERAEVLEAELSRTIGGLKDLLNELTFGDLAGGTPQERLDRLRTEQAEAAERVRNGEEGASEEFAAITREILGLSEQLFGSAGQYGQDLGLSRSEVEQLIAQAEADVNAQLQEAREQAGTLPEQQLTEANASLDDIAVNTAQLLAELRKEGVYFGGGSRQLNFSYYAR